MNNFATYLIREWCYFKGLVNCPYIWLADLKKGIFKEVHIAKVYVKKDELF